jgi:hypothetical protein
MYFLYAKGHMLILDMICMKFYINRFVRNFYNFFNIWELYIYIFFKNIWLSQAVTF